MAKKEYIIIFPWESEQFKAAWASWKDYKKEVHKFNYKNGITEQAALKHLSELTEHNEEIAIEAIIYAMSRQWKGIFMTSDLKNKLKAKQNEQRPLSWRKEQ